jgi:hypothetical protein
MAAGRGQLTVSVTGGRQRRKSVYGKTRAEARDKLVKLQARLAAGLPIPEKMLVAEWLEHWMMTRVVNRLAPKTVISYRHIVDAYLKPDWSLGRVRLAALNPERVQQMLDDLADRGVRPPTVKYTLDILRIALSAAGPGDPRRLPLR